MAYLRTATGGSEKRSEVGASTREGAQTGYMHLCPQTGVLGGGALRLGTQECRSTSALCFRCYAEALSTRDLPYTVQSSTAFFSDVSGSFVGMNSCAKKPSNFKSAIALAIVRHCNSCVSSNS